MNYRDSIDPVLGTDYVLFTDYMPWNGDPNEIHKVSYKQLDAGVIDGQLDNMGHGGIEGIRVTYQGSNPSVGAYGHKVLLQLAHKCAIRGMQLMLLMDPWEVKEFKSEGYPSPEAAMIATLKNPDVQAIINDPKLYPNKWIMEFNTKVNTAVVQAAVPGFTIGSWHTHYSWPNIIQDKNGVCYGCNWDSLHADNAKATNVMPCVFSKFNDAGFVTNAAAVLAARKLGQVVNPIRDMSRSVWGDGPARFIWPDAGKTWLNSVAALSLCPKPPKMISIVSFNDTDEGTDHESEIVGDTGIAAGGITLPTAI